MKKILIVDDEAATRELLKNILLNNNYEVIGEAANGEEAKKQYTLLKPDLVILDIIMPIVSGFQALKEILNINPKAKVVMLTGIHKKEQVALCIKAGAKDFIIKPFDTERLIQRIEKALNS